MNNNSKQQTLKKRIVVSTFSQIISQIMTSVLAVVILKIITVNLGIHDYGLYATIFAFVTTFSLLTDVGLNAITAREIAKNPQDASDIIGHNMGLRLMLCLVMIPLIVGLSFVFYPHQSAQLHIGVAIMSAYLLFDAVRSVALAYYTSQVRNDIVAVINTLQQVALTCFVIIAALSSWKLYGFIGSFIAANLVGALLALYVARRMVRVRPKISIKKWKAILAMSISLGIIQVINMLYLKADSIMLSLMKSTTEVGIYGVAYSLILAFLALPSFIMSALIPSMATSESKIVKQIVEKAFQYMAILACLLAVGGFAVRNQIVLLVASKSFTGAATPFAILALASAFSYLNNVFGFASVSLNKHKKLVYVSGLTLILNIGLNLLFIPKYSIAGAAWATVISEFLAFASVYRIFHLETGLHIRIAGSLIRPILAAYVTLGGIELLDKLWHVPGTLLPLLVQSSFTILIYAAALFVFGSMPEEVSSLIVRLAKRLLRLTRT